MSGCIKLRRVIRILFTFSGLQQWGFAGMPVHLLSQAVPETSTHTVCGPQVGVLDDVLTNVHNVVRKGRLGPGQMISANLVEGVFKESVQIAREVSTAQPYREWLASSSRLADLAPPGGYLEEPQMGAAEVGRTHLSIHISSILEI